MSREKFTATEHRTFAGVEVRTLSDGCIGIEVIDAATGLRQCVASVRPVEDNDAHRVEDSEYGVTVETPYHAFAARKCNLI